MTVIEHESIREMCVLQDTLNSVINPNWHQAGYDWHRAAWLEAAELMEHVGWKWWKAQAPDMPQAHIEIVDIWHFVLSDYLVRLGDNAPEALAKEINDPEAKVSLYRGELRRLDELELRQATDMFAGLAAQGFVSAQVFNRIREVAGLSWAELRRSYLAKNLLNVFRQRNGYKSGSYVKIWFGAEDNVALVRLMGANPDASASTLYAALEREYELVLKSKDAA